MEESREIKRAIIFSAVAALVTIVPYIVAKSVVEPEAVFSGFLINPIDGFSYLAKMYQGSSGGWLFQLPFAPEPGEGVLLFTYHIFLGKLVNITGWSPQFLYHVVRVLASAAMFFTAYLVISYFIDNAKSRWGAFLLILFGSGFGWLGIPFGILASDLKIPESIPFYSAFANAHFPLATLLFLGIILVVLREKIHVWRRFVLIVLLSLLLAIVQPFVFIVLGAIFGFWQIWEIWIRMREMDDKFLDAVRRIPWIPFLGVALGAAPWLIYDYSLTLNHEAISIWNQQNLTPSPQLWRFLLGFGGVFLLALISLARFRDLNRPAGRFLIVWAILQGALLYMPFGLQRRLSLGLYFPLAILAVMALERIVRKDLFNLAFTILFALSIPSNLLVMGSGLAAVSTEQSDLIIGVDELASYLWLTNETEPGTLVLGNETTGNRIPAYSRNRVLYGHPFETPHADQQRALVKSLLSPERDPDAVLKDISELDIRYVLIGPKDLEQGELTWLEEFQIVFSEGAYAIYEISK
jgi:hypothetical protein